MLLYVDGWCDNEHVSAAVRYSCLPGSHERSGRRFAPARANLARMRCLQVLEVAFFLSLTLQQMLYVSCDFDRWIIFVNNHISKLRHSRRRMLCFPRGGWRSVARLGGARVNRTIGRRNEILVHIYSARGNPYVVDSARGGYYIEQPH